MDEMGGYEISGLAERVGRFLRGDGFLVHRGNHLAPEGKSGLFGRGGIDEELEGCRYTYR